MADFTNRWALSMISGGNPLFFPGHQSCPSVSSADGKHAIICLSHQLRVYFLQTRQCIRTVDVDLRRAISVHLDPGNDNQLIVFEENRVFYVNWKEKIENPIVAQQIIEPHIEGLQSVFKVGNAKYLALAESESVFSLHVIDRETARSTLLFEAENISHWATSSDAHKLALVSEAGKILVYDISVALSDSGKTDSSEGMQDVIEASKISFSCPHKFVTCIAVSNSGIAAIGNTTGVINIFYGDAKHGEQQKTLRWHIDPVNCVSFSADEVYLVSGGNEKVLVFWHLESDRTQFLPRLSGSIDCISVDKNRPDLYTVALRVSDDAQKLSAHEILIISAVDLISRLSVCPIRPAFNTSVSRATDAARKRHLAGRNDLLSVKNDITAPTVVHPTSKLLYFARGPSIQAYDIVRVEQAFVQQAAPLVSTGKVRSERQVADPTVTLLAFTTNGSWMATFDYMPTSDFDNLLSSKDISYALKIWHWNESTWVLSSKIVDPHGPGAEIGSIISQEDQSFTTVDKRGGIRVWKPRPNNSVNSPATINSRPSAQTVWTLRRASPPSASKAPVSACYSADGSLLVVSHGSSVKVYEPKSLREIDFELPVIDSPVESLLITGTYLILASQQKIISFDLVSGCVTDLFAQISAPGNGNLVASDFDNQLIAVATNRYITDPEFAFQGKIFIFRPDSMKPIFAASHSSAIASVVYTPTGFLFVDTDCRIGLVAPEIRKSLGEAAETDLSLQMSNMLLNAQAAANILFARAADEKSQNEINNGSERWEAQRTVDAAALQPIFANVEGTSLDSLFERVVRAVQ